MKIFVFIAFSIFSWQLSHAQPTGIHLSWNENKTDKTVAITWLTEKVGYDNVEYGTDSLNLRKHVQAKASFSKPLNSFTNKIVLKDLKPSSCYYYRVGSKKGWSKIYKFRTAPKKGSAGKFIVGVWSDTQNNQGNLNFEQSDSIVKQLGLYPLNIMMETGDIVENGSVVESWKNYFNMAEPLLARYPFLSVTGNHDVVNDSTVADFQKPFPVYYDLFNLPRNQLNYSLDYGAVHFVAINSGWAQGAEKVNKVLMAPGTEEYEWLEKDLAKASKDKDIKWIILYCHYPIYSFGWSNIKTWAEHIKPLLDKYNVDLCVAGHRHVYERHKAIKGDQIFEQTSFNNYDKPLGTVYITNGSAGGSLQGLGGDKLPTMVFTPKEKIYTYAIMTIEKNELRYDLFDKQGRKVDYFVISK